MLTLERPQYLVNEYLTFYVPRTTLGARQHGSVFYQTKRKCLFFYISTSEEIWDTQSWTKDVMQPEYVSLDTNPSLHMKTCRVSTLKYSNPCCFPLKCVKVQSMYSDTCYILGPVVCLFMQFTFKKPVSLFCVLRGANTLWQQNGLFVKAKQPSSVCVLALLDQDKLIDHNNDIIPHDWFCKVGNNVCILLLCCFYFISCFSLRINKFSFTPMCLSKWYVFLSLSHAYSVVLMGRPLWADWSTSIKT